MSRAWKVGDLVRYNDVANIGLTYIVTKVNDDPWSTYELAVFYDDDADSDGTIITDGRQPRWQLVLAADTDESRPD